MVKDCKYCGQTHEFKRYPAYSETCRKCGNPNHFADKCHTGNKRAGASSKKNFRSKTMHAVATSDEEFFIGSVNVNIDDAEWYETVKVKNTNIHFQLDTGAKCNVLSSADLKTRDKNLKVVPTFFSLKSLSGHYILFASTVILPYVWKDAMLPYVKFYIIDQTVNPVLGADTCSKLGPIQQTHSIKRKKTC